MNLNVQVLVLLWIPRIKPCAHCKDMSDAVLIQNEFVGACNQVTEPDLVSDLVQMINSVRMPHTFLLLIKFL